MIIKTICFFEFFHLAAYVSYSLNFPSFGSNSSPISSKVYPLYGRKKNNIIYLTSTIHLVLPNLVGHSTLARIWNVYPTLQLHPGTLTYVTQAQHNFCTRYSTTEPNSNMSNFCKYSTIVKGTHSSLTWLSRGKWRIRVTSISIIWKTSTTYS